MSFNINVGTPQSIETTYNSFGFDCISISDNKIIASYAYLPGASWRATVRVLDNISGTIISTIGNRYDLSVNPTYYTKLVKINTNKFVAVYYNYSSNQIICRVGTVSGINIAYGSEITVVSGVSINNTDLLHITSPSTDKIAIAFGVSGASNIKVVAGSVSGYGVTFGTAVNISSYVSTLYDLESYDTDKIAITYQQPVSGTTNVGLYTFSISGTTISLGSNIIITDLDTNIPAMITKIDTNKILVALGQNPLTLRYITISGTTPTLVSKQAITSSFYRFTNIASPSTGNWVVTTMNNSTKVNKLIAGNVTDSTINYGSEFTTETISTRSWYSDNSICAVLPNNKIINIYSTSYPGSVKSIIADVNFITITTNTSTVTSKAKIKSGKDRDLTSKGRIKQEGLTKSITSKSRIETISLTSKDIQAKASIDKSISRTLQAKGSMWNKPVGVAILSSENFPVKMQDSSN